jgi:pentatricopeptide repeat protein
MDSSMILFYSTTGKVFKALNQGIDLLKCFLGKSVLNLFIVVFIALMFSSAEARLSIQQTTSVDQFQAKSLYEALTAEIYNKMGDEKRAVDHYQRLVSYSDDPAIAKRATELATVTAQLKKALIIAKRWVDISPKNLEANQYLALLLLRNSRFDDSAHQLNNIVQLVDETLDKAEVESQISTRNRIKSKQSLKFIGSLLAVEAHHDKAYKVFKLYLKQFDDKQYLNQKKLISANLAMKAKKYSDVVSLLENLKQLDRQNFVDASVMKAKALQRLSHTSEAIQVLSTIKDYKETSDSSRLELVRLLVLDKQKKLALPVLEKLIVKHKKNKALLKSLIALQIDQSMLKRAEMNIQKLRLSEKYRDDAEYFYGEVLEKRGDASKALEAYQKVSDGAFIKNAHKKIIHLVNQINGTESLASFFDLKQKQSTKSADKAYWIKLQADNLFDAKKYKLALASYNKAIGLSPDNLLYYYHRGLLNERMGQLQSAENDFNHVIKNRKNDADALNALGYMLSVNTQRLNEAESYIKKAYEIKPNDPVIMDSLGFLLFKTGDLTTAEKFLRKAFRLIKNPEVASHLISVLAKMNQHQEALRIYDEMKKKYPNNQILKNLKKVLHADL